MKKYSKNILVFSCGLLIGALSLPTPWMYINNDSNSAEDVDIPVSKQPVKSKKPAQRKLTANYTIT